VPASTFALLPKNITYCGLKDEDGITEQVLALPANVIPQTVQNPIFSILGHIAGCI
jgi:tRNA(Glu) U13 pseudouridine synthase TruD